MKFTSTIPQMDPNGHFDSLRLKVVFQPPIVFGRVYVSWGRWYMIYLPLSVDDVCIPLLCAGICW